MSLQGKRIVVTGAASGCGEAAVRGCIAAGAFVVATDVNDEHGRQVVHDAGSPERCKYLHLDVSNRAEVFRVIDVAAELMGGIDAIFNAGGIIFASKPEDTTDEQWDRMFNVHVKGTLYTNQAVFPHMRRAGGGSIVNFGSAAGVRGTRNFSVYSAAKGAVFAWTRALAQEWGEHNIRVNAIAPYVWSSMRRQMLAQLKPASEHSKGAVAVSASQVVLNNGQPGDALTDLAPLLVLLAGDGGRFLTGQTYAVDGGLMMLGS
ncbi:MAG: SDR family oxidoreductase [Steroidobacteraceae bacterium]